MPEKMMIVSFGSSQGGLSTVGYVILNDAGGTHTARTTSGVFELGTNTGIYGKKITFLDGFKGSVLWDNGAGTPRYAAEEVNLGQDVASVVDALLPFLRQVQKSVIDFITDFVDGKFKKMKATDLSGIEKRLDAFELKIGNPVKPVEVKKTYIQQIQKGISEDLIPLKEQIDELKSHVTKMASAISAKIKDPEKPEKINLTPYVDSINQKISTLASEIKDLKAKEIDIPDHADDFNNVFKGISKMIETLTETQATIVSNVTKASNTVSNNSNDVHRIFERIENAKSDMAVLIKELRDAVQKVNESAKVDTDNSNRKLLLAIRR